MIDPRVWELLPYEDPASSQPWIETALDDLEVKDEHFRRAYKWAHQLLAQVGDRNIIVSAILGALEDSQSLLIQDISAGLIPFRRSIHYSEAGTRQNYLNFHPSVPIVVIGDTTYTFGVVIGLSSRPEDKRPIVFRPEPTGFFTIAERFPLVIEKRETSEDALPGLIGNATATCYAKPCPAKKFYCGSKWRDGIIVARHVLHSVGLNCGAIVPLSNGGSAVVTDIDQSTNIDAAIIDIAPDKIPKSARQISPAVANPIGSAVTVRGRQGAFNANILRIMDHPTYFGNLVAHRVFIDNHGVPGDSGGLTIQKINGAASGIYIGSTNTAPNEGVIQTLLQVCKYFDIDVFD